MIFNNPVPQESSPHAVFYTFHIRWVSHNKNVFIGLQPMSRKRGNSDWATTLQNDLKETSVIQRKGKNLYCLMDEGPERVLISNCFGCSGKKIQQRTMCFQRQEIGMCGHKLTWWNNTVFPHTSLSSVANSVSDSEEIMWDLKLKLV